MTGYGVLERTGFYVVKAAQLASLNSNGLPGTDPNHQSNGTVRLDYQASPKNHLDLLWLYNVQNRFYRRSTSYTYVDQQAAGRQIEPAWAMQAEYTAAVTPNFMIDTRAGYMHLHEDQQNEPGVTPTTLSVADVTLSTLKGVQQTYPLTRSGLTRLASSTSWFKGGWLGSHSFKGDGSGRSRAPARTQMHRKALTFSSTTTLRIKYVSTTHRSCPRASSTCMRYSCRTRGRSIAR